MAADDRLGIPDGGERDSSDRRSDGGLRAPQVVIAALCVLGLLVAAAAAPTLGGAAGGDGNVPGEGSGGQGTSGDGVEVPGGGGDPPRFDVDIRDLLRWFLPEERRETDEQQTNPMCTIEVSPRPTPGRVVTVTVTQAGEPVDGALVRFDGEPAGRTDSTGEVRARVPYVRQLVVSATLPNDVRCVAMAETALNGGKFAVAAPSLNGQDDIPGNGRNLTRTYTVDGEVQLVIDGTPDPGSTVTLRASVEGVPMRNATVWADGRRVGTTDEEGTYVLAVPTDGTERVSIRVERGDFAGETTVIVRLLKARLAPVQFLSLPGSPAVVRAKLGDAPARNATVTRAGRQLGRMDEEGHLRIRLPGDPGATVTVRAEGQTATAAVWPLYAGTALIIGIPTVVLLVTGAFTYRVGATPSRAGRGLTTLLRRVFAGLVASALRLADGLVRTLGWLIVRTRGMIGWLRQWATRLRVDWRGVLRSLASWLRTLPGRAWHTLRALSLLGAAGREPAAPDASSTSNGKVGPSAFDLLQAWRTVARRVVPSVWRTRTPGEVVRIAVAQGLPHDPVERLATVFEEVEYGGRPLTAERRERARQAFGDILAHWRDIEDERPEGGER